MKRRVLRAHANKRCLRILSASHQLRTPSSADRAHAVLCDASFLRALLLTYWQAQAPTLWKRARIRQLNKAAAAAEAAASSPDKKTPDAKGEKAETETQQQLQLQQPHRSGSGQSSVSTATLVARLPVQQLPSVSPFDFLLALTHDAFHGSGGGEESGPLRVHSGSGGGFLFHCLPETVAALHRMRDPNAAENAPHTHPSSTSQPQSSLATPAWLAASVAHLDVADGDLSAHQQKGSTSGSTAPPLTFQEVPVVVVDALLSRLHLLQDPHMNNAATVTAAPASAHASSQLKNEAKAIENFIDFNTACLNHGGALDVAHGSNNNNSGGNSRSAMLKLRLCAMPRFTDVTAALGHHALKRQRQRMRGRASTEGSTPPPTPAAAAATAAAGSTTTSGGPLPSKPFLPRSFFIATQSHDVRRRLPSNTALLRLTTKPDAMWIELRGTAYTYDDDTGKISRAGGRHGGEEKRTRSPAADKASSAQRVSRAHTSTAAAAAAASMSSRGPTVMSVAPALSRADVAFMKHLGTATHVPLPEKATASTTATTTATTTSPAAAASTGKAEEGAAPVAARKRSRQKGQNPLSMKKKQKREVFRA